MSKIEKLSVNLLLYNVQTTPLVAIVILNYNGRHHLKSFCLLLWLPRMQIKKLLLQIIAQSIHSVQWLQSNYPMYRNYYV